jgi:MFS transporter, DHA2 family, glioxin efflux transporter
MLQKLAIYVPDLDPSEILGVGATEIRNSFPAADVPGIVHGYMDGLQAAYALTIGTAGVSTVISLASRWRTLKGVNTAAAV